MYERGFHFQFICSQYLFAIIELDSIQKRLFVSFQRPEHYLASPSALNN